MEKVMFLRAGETIHFQGIPIKLIEPTLIFGNPNNFKTAPVLGSTWNEDWGIYITGTKHMDMRNGRR